jgi:DNA-binding SARP family transcriptional activator
MPDMTNKTKIRLFLFGETRLESGGKTLDVDTRKAIALLAFLVVSGQAHQRDYLAAMFWPESNSSGARGALRRTLSALRKVLPEDLLEISREVIGLAEANGLWCDARAFRQHLEAYRVHHHPPGETCRACFTGLTEATDLYRGDFMAGFTLRDSLNFDHWQFQEAEQFRRELAEALVALVNMHNGQRDYEAALPPAHRLLDLDPLNESAYRRLMSLYANLGRREAALRQYRECVRVLEEELGVEPLDETSELYEAIRTGKYPQERSQAEQLTVVEKPPEAQAEQSDCPPLVGRKPELEKLREIYGGIRTRGHLIVLTGEIGIGKTHLAEEFCTWVGGQGGVVLKANCYEGETNLAYGAILEALRGGLKSQPHQKWVGELAPYELAEAARLMPELHELVGGLPPAEPMEGPGAQHRFFASLTRLLLALLGGQGERVAPGVFLVDDLQWADQATYDLLAYLIRRLSDVHLLVLCTCRAEDLGRDTPIQALFSLAARQEALSMLKLERLDADQVAELIRVAERRGMRFSAGQRERLTTDTEGLPLFLAAYLQPEMQWGAEEPWQGGQPASVREVLQARLAQLSETAHQLMQTAAVIGRSFDFDTLLETAGRSEEEAISALEELIRRGLARETGSALRDTEQLLYDFSHELVRSLVYENTSLARRRLLHRRVAESLAGRMSGHPATNLVDPALAGQVAYHYRNAGLTSPAVAYYQLAGEYARSLYANGEALEHFRSALALGSPERRRLYRSIGELETMAGQYAAAIHSFMNAAAHSGVAELPEIERLLGLVYDRLGDWEQAGEHFQVALSGLVYAPDERLQARLLADWSLTCHRQGDHTRAHELAQRALTLAEESGDDEAQTQVHNLLGMLARRQQNYDVARQHLSVSCELSERLNHKTAQVAALNNLALVEGDVGEYPLAHTLLKQALELCSRLGDRHREAALRNNLADLLHAAGEREGAMEQLKQAVSMFAEVGVDSGQWQPEIWKLTEW